MIAIGSQKYIFSSAKIMGLNRMREQKMTNIKFTNVCIHKTCEVSAGLVLIVAMVEACGSVSQLLRLFFHSCRGGLIRLLSKVARFMMNENHKGG